MDWHVGSAIGLRRPIPHSRFESRPYVLFGRAASVRHLNRRESRRLRAAKKMAAPCSLQALLRDAILESAPPRDVQIQIADVANSGGGEPRTTFVQRLASALCGDHVVCPSERGLGRD